MKKRKNKDKTMTTLRNTTTYQDNGNNTEIMEGKTADEGTVNDIMNYERESQMIRKLQESKKKPNNKKDKNTKTDEENTPTTPKNNDEPKKEGDYEMFFPPQMKK